MHEQVKFIRRVHPDGSYRSICLYCFLTSAVAKATPELKAEEERHICHRSIWDQIEVTQDRNSWLLPRC